MEIPNNKLYDQLADFQIGSAADALTFVKRLSRENNWSHTYAERCVEEYKKFIYLAMLSDQPVTPSDQVDQVWHLHLTYTHSYWNELCQKILKKPLHHGPTKGGKSESQKYHLQYQETLDAYTETFGDLPPNDIWPDSETRFRHADKFVRLNTTAYVLINKPRIFSVNKPPRFNKKPLRSTLVIASLPLLLAACVSSDQKTSALIVVLIIGLIYVIYKFRKSLSYHNNNGNSAGGGCGSVGGGSNDGNSGGDSGCGGCGGCGG